MTALVALARSGRPLGSWPSSSGGALVPEGSSLEALAHLAERLEASLEDSGRRPSSRWRRR
jgi:hypothetical protein